MKPKVKATPKQRTDTRITVSFSAKVWEMIRGQMELRGFNNNVSAYLADAARRDYERTIEIELAAMELADRKGKPAAGEHHADTVARRIIKHVVKRAHSRDASATCDELLKDGVLPSRVIAGFAQSPQARNPVISAKLEGPSRPVVVSVY